MCHNSLEISALLKLLPSKDLGKTQCEERSQQQLLNVGWQQTKCQWISHWYLTTTKFCQICLTFSCCTTVFCLWFSERAWAGILCPSPYNFQFEKKHRITCSSSLCVLSFLENKQNRVDGHKLLTKLKATNSGGYSSKNDNAIHCLFNYCLPQKGDFFFFYKCLLIISAVRYAS